MQEFADRLARLAELGDDELTALEQEMVAAFDAADTGGNVDAMQQIAEGLDQVRAEVSNRSGAEEAPAAEEAMPAEMPEEEPAVAASAETTEVPSETTETPAEPAVDPTTPQDEAAPTTGEASDTSTAPEGAAATTEEETVEVTSEDVPAENQPVAAAGPNYTIRAGGDIPKVAAGSVLTNMDAVNDALVAKINGMRGIDNAGSSVVASITRENIPEERQLKAGDPVGNSQKIRNFWREFAGQGTDAMVAAGWCAPKTPLYDVPGIGVTSTPVADSLASFGVDRGGITWQVPPGLGGVNWTNFGRWMNIADEGDPADWQFVPGVSGVANPVVNKPCIDVPCGTEASIELLAIPLCLCFDVLYTRANPEMVKANTDLVLVAQARFMEQYLMANLFGNAAVTNAETTAGNDVIGQPDTGLGIFRDWLVQLRLVAGQFRWRNRLDPSFKLRVYAPAWLRDAMAADLTIQMPGDDTLNVGYSEIAGYLNEINVEPVWYMDDVPTGIGTGATTSASNFDSMMGWPTQAEWLLTVPGAFTRLDGGSLDLGVVRTKEDVQKNKYCEFAETFEAVAYMGPTNTGSQWAWRGTTPVLIRGGFAPAVSSIANNSLNTEAG